MLLLLSVVNGLVFFWVNFNLSINAMGSFRAADERGCMPPLKDNEVYLIGIETSLPIRLPIKVNNVSLTSLDGEEIPSCFILDLEETNWKMGAGVFDIKIYFMKSNLKAIYLMISGFPRSRLGLPFCWITRLL